LKIQLEEAKIEKRHKEECEAIRRLIAAQPPQQRLNDFEKEVGG
jgi:THO complex subunit 7